MGAYQFKITIKGSKPPIWRRVLVPDKITFSQLHQVIQMVFCWSNAHLYEFEFPSLGICISEDSDDFFEDERLDSGELIEDWIGGIKKFRYTYDFGDDWIHEIAVEKYLGDRKERYAEVMAYKGDAIPEDCGGIWGYYDLLETLNDPERLAEASEEYGIDYEEWALEQGLAEYDLEGVNEELKTFILRPEEEKVKEKVKEKPQDRKIIRGIFDSNWDEDEDGDEGEDWYEDEDWDEDWDGIEDWEQKAARLKAELTEYLRQAGENKVSLLEILGSMKKDGLLMLARRHDMNAVTKLKKKDLVAAIKARMLSCEHMSEIFLGARDEEIRLLESMISGEYYERTIEEMEPVDMEYLLEYSYIQGDMLNIYYVSEEVKKAYHCINTPQFQEKRKRTALITDYIRAATRLYAVVESEVILEMFRRNEGEELTEKELTDTYDQVCRYRGPAIYGKGTWIDRDRMGEGLDDLYREIEDVPYYYPNASEVSIYASHTEMKLNPGIERLFSYLSGTVELDDMDVLEIMISVWEGMEERIPVEELAKEIEEEVADLSLIEKKQLKKILQEMRENIRMYEYRGHTMKEMGRRI